MHNTLKKTTLHLHANRIAEPRALVFIFRIERQWLLDKTNRRTWFFQKCPPLPLSHCSFCLPGADGGEAGLSVLWAMGANSGNWLIHLGDREEELDGCSSSIKEV